MSTYFRRTLLAASLTLGLAGFAGATLAVDALPAVDNGKSDTNQMGSVTVALRLRNQDALEKYIRDTVTPGNKNFQKFLSTADFARQYGASDADLATVQSFLKKNGLQTEVLGNRMAIRATGNLSQLSATFGTSFHDYTSVETGQRFRKPATALKLPTAVANLVIATTGLSSEPKYISHRVRAVGAAPPLPSFSAKTLSAKSTTPAKPASGNPTASGVEGEFTVGDVANFYNINPLYNRGITGKGSTVAIVTLSNFYPADAQAYWDGIGLKTKKNRITHVLVDGGGVFDGGSGETALDVQQSGGLAPDADIIVYDAPNAGNGFTDAFIQAVVDNKAESISTSWGSPEMYNFAALNIDGASDTDTTDVGDLQLFHQIFMEAAAQGQSVFAATGDSGAYDTVRGLGTGTGVGDFSAPLSVDSPASDPYITGAGGTTRPFKYAFLGPDGVTPGPTAQIKNESVWGWDYIQTYFQKNFNENINVFSVGAGGGVSVYWRAPWYQQLTPGVKTSEKNQALVYNDVDGPFTYLKLPAKFPGRNLPDISLNADPETGYIVVSTTDGGVSEGNGGTSFVAPQLNGISALLRQSTGHRIGLWNPQVYAMHLVFGSGALTPFNDIKSGDNWFYAGKSGYEPGAGIGTLNVANFDIYLRSGLFNIFR